jgi:hypothetical protein
MWSLPTILCRSPEYELLWLHYFLMIDKLLFLSQCHLVNAIFVPIHSQLPQLTVEMLNKLLCGQHSNCGSLFALFPSRYGQEVFEHLPHSTP